MLIYHKQFFNQTIALYYWLIKTPWRVDVTGTIIHGTSYQPNCVLNEILGQARQEQYSELQVHWNKNDYGRISFLVEPT